MKKDEIWKKISGFPDYEISNTGKVKSLARYQKGSWGCTWKRKEKVLKNYINTSGYEFVRLRLDGKSHNKLVHRLVAEHFINNESNKPCVNHLDLDKLNNNLYNLEWVTFEENTQHYINSDSYSRPWTHNATGCNAKEITCKRCDKTWIGRIEPKPKYCKYCRTPYYEKELTPYWRRIRERKKESLNNEFVIHKA